MVPVTVATGFPSRSTWYPETPLPASLDAAQETVFVPEAANANTPSGVVGAVVSTTHVTALDSGDRRPKRSTADTV